MTHISMTNWLDDPRFTFALNEVANIHDYIVHGHATTRLSYDSKTDVITYIIYPRYSDMDSTIYKLDSYYENKTYNTITKEHRYARAFNGDFTSLLVVVK